jgi:uracil-DNA glycosylase
MSNPEDPNSAIAELLRWYVEMGADEAIGDSPGTSAMPQGRTPHGRTPEGEIPGGAAGALPPLAAAATAGRHRSTAAAKAEPPAAGPPAAAGLAGAQALADSAADLGQLEAAVKSFSGCPLRFTATNTVFADGTAGAPVMLIGEAPGADEDRLGKPFVGRSGQLLDRMLATIGLERSRNLYITNILFWRPPGNRKPTQAEIGSCLPFVRRHIALAHPELLILCGGTAAGALLGTAEGITKLRGRWFDLAVPDLDQSIPSIPIYHPSFLLRSPERKKEAWRDLISIQIKLEDLHKNSQRKEVIP